MSSSSFQALVRVHNGDQDAAENHVLEHVYQGEKETTPYDN